LGKPPKKKKGELSTKRPKRGGKKLVLGRNTQQKEPGKPLGSQLFRGLDLKRTANSTIGKNKKS